MLSNVLCALWLGFYLENPPFPIKTVCSGVSGSLRDWVAFRHQEGLSPPVNGKEGLMTPPSKWPVLLVGNWVAHVACRPPSRGLGVSLCQSPDAPAGWRVCPPQGPVGAYAAGSLGRQLILPPSVLQMWHARTSHGV